MKLFTLIALLTLIITPHSSNAEMAPSGSPGEGAAATGYGYGYAEYSRGDNSNLFLGEDYKTGVGVYPINRNTFLNEVPETTPPQQTDFIGTYESSVNPYMGQKVHPQDDPAKLLENYQRLHTDYWTERGLIY